MKFATDIPIIWGEKVQRAFLKILKISDFMTIFHEKWPKNNHFQSNIGLFNFAIITQFCLSRVEKK